MKENRFNSILAVEASDCFDQELANCDVGLSGKALAKTTIGGLINLGLDIRSCRG